MLIQTTVLAAVPALPVVPDLLLVLAVYLGVRGQTVGGVVAAFLPGYFLDTFSGPMHVVPREIPPELDARLAVSGVVVLVAFALVGVRLWYLQVERGQEMRYLSEQNRIRVVSVPAARGVVYDRHGEILVDNRPSFDVVFVPEDARDRRRQVLRNLAGFLGDAEPAILNAVRTPTGKRPPYQGIVIRRD